MTIRGEALRFAEDADSSALRVRLETERDLSELEPGAPIFHFESNRPDLRFSEIKAIVLRPETRDWLGSNARSLEWYRLGPLGGAALPPPRWAREAGGHYAWERSVPIDPPVGSAYLNHAQSCWAATSLQPEQSSGEFLFRTRFELPPGETYGLARLRIVGDAEFIEVRLNDLAVQRGPSGESGIGESGIGEFDVTDLVAPETNVLGFHVRSPTTEGSPRPWFAFHLELVHNGEEERKSTARARQALLVGRDSQRVWGKILAVDEDSVSLRSLYGTHAFAWENVEGLLFPYGWVEEGFPGEERPIAKMLGWIPGLGSPSIALPEPQGLPIGKPAAGAEGSLLFRDGTRKGSASFQMSGTEIRLVAQDEEFFPVGRKEVAAIYSPTPDGTQLRKPAGNLAPLHCYVRTIFGETVRGVLRRLNSDLVMLEEKGGDFLKIDTDRVVWVWFPNHLTDPIASTSLSSLRQADPRSDRPAKIAILARSAGYADDGRVYQRLNADIQEAAFLAGYECEAPPPPQGPSAPLDLSPRVYSLVISVDPAGEYLDTWATPGDGRSGLAAYVAQGGTLLVYADSPPLATAVVNDDGTFRRSGEGTTLASELNLATVRPGHPGPNAERSFLHPPNLPQSLFFQRSASVPAGLEGLPPFVYAPSLRGAAFRPTVSEAGTVRSVYSLRSSADDFFGAGLNIVKHGKGRVIVINHLLWKAEIEDRPFAQTALPVIVGWAVRQTATASASE